MLEQKESNPWGCQLQLGFSTCPNLVCEKQQEHFKPTILRTNSWRPLWCQPPELSVGRYCFSVCQNEGRFWEGVSCMRLNSSGIYATEVLFLTSRGGVVPVLQICLVWRATACSWFIVAYRQIWRNDFIEIWWGNIMEHKICNFIHVCGGSQSSKTY